MPCFRFVYLSHPLIQRSAAEIRQQWQRKHNQQQRQGRKLAVSLSAANSTVPGAHIEGTATAGSNNGSSSSSRVQIKVRARVRGAAGGQLVGDGGQSLRDEGQPFVLTAQHMEDDAFGTLLQVRRLNMIVTIIMSYGSVLALLLVWHARAALTSLVDSIM